MQNIFMDNMQSFMSNANFGSKQNVLTDLMSKNVETVTAAAQVMSKSAERLMQNNAKMAQEMSNRVANSMQNINSDPQQLVFETREVMQKVLSNNKEVAQSATQAGMEIFDLVSNRASENIVECMNHMSSAMPHPKEPLKKK